MSTLGELICKLLIDNMVRRMRRFVRDEEDDDDNDEDDEDEICILYHQ